MRSRDWHDADDETPPRPHGDMKLDRCEANNTEKSAPKPGGPGGAK
jgi:hypothetical protein